MKDYFKDMRLIPVDKRQPLEEVLQMLLDYNAKGEKVYVDYGCALNYDGTWKHGGRELTKAEQEFLKNYDWNLNK